MLLDPHPCTLNKSAHHGHHHSPQAEWAAVGNRVRSTWFQVCSPTAPCDLGQGGLSFLISSVGRFVSVPLHSLRNKF